MVLKMLCSKTQGYVVPPNYQFRFGNREIIFTWHCAQFWLVDIKLMCGCTIFPSISSCGLSVSGVSDPSHLHMDT